jgi:hypothetical protein
MSAPKVPAIRFTATAPEGHAQRAAGLYAQARQEAAAHVGEAITNMGALAALSDEIGNGGAVYHPCVRDELTRLSTHLEFVARRIAQIMDRSAS